MTVNFDEMGPVDYLVMEFSEDRLTGEAFPLLLDLVDRGIIRIIDLAFVRKGLDGTVSSMSVVDVQRLNLLELALFEGASSGLLDEQDLAEAAATLEPGSLAGILVYENTWAAPFAAALRRSGGHLMASGRISVAELISALDATEAAVQPN